MMVYLVEDSPVIRERLRDMVLELDPGTRVHRSLFSTLKRSSALWKCNRIWWCWI